MAYAVARPGGRWELREACTTSRGPRSRTLASFRVLTDDVVERARKAATIAVSAEDLREAARRAGVPAEMSAADTAARILLAEMAAGRSPSPSLRRLLAARVGRGGGRVREAAGGGAVEWLASTARESSGGCGIPTAGGHDASG